MNLKTTLPHGIPNENKPKLAQNGLKEHKLVGKYLMNCHMRPESAPTHSLMAASWTDVLNVR